MTPKELGALADQYWHAREARLAADKEAQRLKDRESSLFAQLIAEMREENLTVIGGQTASLTLSVHDEPVVTDWEEFYAHVLKENDMSLMQRRLSTSAIKERWLAGVQVPGVGTFPVFKLGKSKL